MICENWLEAAIEWIESTRCVRVTQWFRWEFSGDRTKSSLKVWKATGASRTLCNTGTSSMEIHKETRVRTFATRVYQTERKIDSIVALTWIPLVLKFENYGSNRTRGEKKSRTSVGKADFQKKCKLWTKLFDHFRKILYQHFLLHVFLLLDRWQFGTDFVRQLFESIAVTCYTGVSGDPIFNARFKA